MKFIDIARDDIIYMSEIRSVYNGALVSFIVVVYSLSLLAILTEQGRQIAESLASLLPSVLRVQYNILKNVDEKSHLSYLISIPAVICIGAYYSRRMIIATRALNVRMSSSGRYLEASASEGVIICVSALLCFIVLVFSGTISGGRSDSGGWLTWPMSGIIGFGATGLAITGSNSVFVSLTFKKRTNSIG